MDEWWSTMPIDHKLLYAIAGTVSLILVVQLVMSLFGLGGHADADADVPDGDLDAGGDVGDAVAVHDAQDIPDGHDGHHDAGVKVLSIRTIMAFLTGLSWTMLAVLRAGGGYLAAAAAGIAVGALFGAGVIGIMMMMSRLQVSGNIDMRNAEGVEGTVYLPIPPSRTGNGQVQLMVQSRIREMDAVTDETETLAVGTKVITAYVIDNNVAVVVTMED